MTKVNPELKFNTFYNLSNQSTAETEGSQKQA